MKKPKTFADPQSGINPIHRVPVIEGEPGSYQQSVEVVMRQATDSSLKHVPTNCRQNQAGNVPFACQP